MATPCKIRIVRELDGVYRKYQPTVGMIYDATIYPAERHATHKHWKAFNEFAVLDICGKKIVARQNEYEKLSEGEGPHGVAWLAQKINEGKAMLPLTEMDVSIIRGLAVNNMSIPKTAKAVFMHPNTIRYHAKRIKEKTGCDPLDFFGLCKLLMLVEETEGKENGKA